MFCKVKQHQLIPIKIIFLDKILIFEIFIKNLKKIRLHFNKLKIKK